MNINGAPRILGTISLIHEVESLMARWAKRLPDPAAELTVYQLDDLKRDLVNQLLAELLDNPQNLDDFEPFIQQATAYLKQFDRKNGYSSDLKDSLKEVERMISAPVLVPMPA